MRRRDFTLGMAASLPVLAGCAPVLVPERSGSGMQASLFIPGYHPEKVRPVGEPPDSRRRAKEGPETMLTRISPRGEVRQAVFPVIAHDVAISPDGRAGFFGRMNLGGGEGAAHHVTFDPQTLEMIAVGRSLGPGWRGGGHGLFLPDGTVLCAERAPERPYAGRPSDHYGRLSRRDPMTLRVLDTLPTHGIDPHELRLSDDGRSVIVANYGSVPRRRGGLWQVVEPAVTVVDLDSGRLLRRLAVPDPHAEVRHLALGREGRIFAIRARQGLPGDNAIWLQAIGDVADALPVDPNPTASYLPMAPVLLDRAGGPVRVLARGEPEAHLLEGLSVEYDSLHNEFLAIFPSSHRLMVFSGDDGALVHSIDMRSRGMVRPSGLALLPDSDRYVIAGYWQGLIVAERGSHRVVHRLTGSAPVVGGHSHMTAA